MIGLLGLDHQFASIEHRGRLSLTGDTLAAALRRLAVAPEIDEVAILSTCNRTEVYVSAADWDAVRALLLGYLSRIYHAAEDGATAESASALAARIALPAEPTPLSRALVGAADADRSANQDAAAESARAAVLTGISGEAPDLPEVVARALYALEEQDAARHLFRVAAGLESMVVGEAQILGQVRDALAAAEQEDTIGDELRALFTTALKMGKRVRTETEIGRADVSVAGLAVRVAREELGGLRGRSALVVGAGRTSQLCAELLRAEGVGRLMVTNRTSAAAADLAQRVQGEELPFARLAEGVAATDIVMSATAAPTPVLSAATTARALASRTAPLVIIDLAVPPDVDPAAGKLPSVRLFSLDELRLRDAEETAAPPHLAAEIARAEVIIAEGMRDFQRGRTIRRMAPGIATLRRHVESSQQSELARALAQLGDLTPEEQQVVARFGQRLVDKMFHHLVSRIRALAEYDEVPPEVTLRVLEQLLTNTGSAERRAHDHSDDHTADEAQGTRKG